MYSQSFSSSSYSSSSNSNTPPNTVTDPMYQDIPQSFNQGYGNPVQPLDVELMGYHQQNNMMMMEHQPFGADGMMQPDNGAADYYGQQYQGIDQQYQIDYQMMQHQMMIPAAPQNFQPEFQQDAFQPLPQQMAIDHQDFGYMGNFNAAGASNVFNGFENLSPMPTDNYDFINAQPPAPRRKSTKKKVPKVSTMHLNSSCSNCGTRETKMWRRNEKGETECNACNLYKSSTGETRPAHLWNKPTIKRKRRAPAAPVVPVLQEVKDEEMHK